MPTTDHKPSRLPTQDPQEVNAPGNKPLENRPGASPDHDLVHSDGAGQQGTTGAIHTPIGNTIPDPVNPQATKPATTSPTTENMAYAHNVHTPEAREAVEQTRAEPPPGRED